VLQGFVAGPMIPLSQTLLLRAIPKALAGLAMALWAMTTLVAPVMGPLLGGWITDNISWPWIFYINIPVGHRRGFITWSIYRKRDSVTRQAADRPVGLALLVVWIGALQIMLDKGKELRLVPLAVIVALAVIALVGFAFFVIWELTDKHPVVDLRCSRGATSGPARSPLSVGYGLFFGNVVLLPLWLQQYMGYTATEAGMVLAPVGLLALAALARGRQERWPRSTRAATPPCLHGVRAGAVDALALQHPGRFGTIMIPTIVQGVAMAFFFIPLVTITLSGHDAGPHAGGVRAVELRAHHRRRDRHLDLHHLVGKPRRSCITRS
jgi:DHA2 family multidrug resistance protein